MEDIKILKEKIEQWQPYRKRGYFSDIEYEIDKEIKAIENILGRLEQLEKENKKIKDNLCTECMRNIEYLLGDNNE